MILIQKLKSNLSQSEQWAASFKNQIKQCMEEITLTNQQISQISRKNINLKSQIEACLKDSKRQNQQKSKIGYKTDKIQIQIQETENRLKVYLEVCKKKEEWRNELMNRISLMEVDIEREKCSVQEIDQSEWFNEQKSQYESCRSFGDQSEGHLSFKEQSLKKVFSKPRVRIDHRLKIIKNTEEQYLRQLEKCRTLSAKLEAEVRKEHSLTENVRSIQDFKYSLANKQNYCFQTIPELSENRNGKQGAKTLRQLQQKNKNCGNEIINLHKKINNYLQYLTNIMACDNTAISVHKQIINFEREVKKQKSTMQSIGNYLLKEAI